MNRLEQGLFESKTKVYAARNLRESLEISDFGFVRLSNILVDIFT